MRYSLFLALVSSAVVSGCATTTTLRHQRAAVRALKVVGLDQQQTDDVVVLLDPITPSNWREQPDVSMTLMTEQNRQENMPIAVGATEAQTFTARTTGRTLVSDTVPLVPLPAFRVTVLNRSSEPLTIDPSQWRISDGRGATAGLLDDEAFRKEVERNVWQLHRDLYNNGQQELLGALRHTLSQLPLIGHGQVIPPGEEWAGLVAFDLYTDQPVSELHVSIGGTQVGARWDTALEFAFAAERRPPRVCEDGRPASILGVCPSDADSFDPAKAGPCIQETRSQFSYTRKQIWIASAPVADSDLYATLQAHAPTRALVNRGLKMRSAGWALVTLGLVGTVATSVALLRSPAHEDALAGLSVLSLSGAGLGLAFKGSSLIHEGVNRYNEMSESTGVCAPVY